MKLPLQVLIVLAFAGGWLWWPHLVAHVETFVHLMESALPAPAFAEVDGGLAWALFLGAELVVVGGAVAGWLYFSKHSFRGRRSAGEPGRLARGLGFDSAYDLLLVRPYRALARLLQWDAAEFLPSLAAALAKARQLGAGQPAGRAPALVHGNAHRRRGAPPDRLLRRFAAGLKR